MPPAFALSQDQTLRFISHPTSPQDTKRTDPKLSLDPHSRNHVNPIQSVVTHQKDTSSTPQISFRHKTQNLPAIPTHPHRQIEIQDATNVSLPSLCKFQRAPRFREPATAVVIGEARFLVGGPVTVNDNLTPIFQPNKFAKDIENTGLIIAAAQHKAGITPE